ncbi:MAG: MBL fold metallo-hydrolase [Roseibium sp.]|uniref:ComEC/Rec2 family competence protein n=1 Tax=Roseibium sp. TaxID=1936156 RepID=UPI002639A7A9|nr:MBL fold metallo-hydrolase [Roseibium sp.]MCV0427938.1 MBL fold metallo-hydrolase [Roseibium sp.]
MSLKVSDLVDQSSYFVSKSSVVLKETKTGAGKLNHLLLGDWLKYLGETHVHKWKTKKGANRSATFAKVRCRGDEGWLRLDEIQKQRALEVNFVDIGQGDGCHIVTPDDEIMLVDAGIGDNMVRFLSWRYNLRGRNVKRAPDFDPDKPAKSPKLIEYVVMSHPDEDHYGGFEEIFENPKLSFDKVFHNGIVERPKEKKIPGVEYPWDLGGNFKADGRKYLYDYVGSSTALKKLVRSFPKTRKVLMSTFRALLTNTPAARISAVGVSMESLHKKVYLGPFDENSPLSMQILGPIVETQEFKGKSRRCLRLLGNEGETKNGHSVIFKAGFGNLTLLLGGDLNSKSQNFLLQSYAGTKSSPEQLEKVIQRLKKKNQPLKAADQKKLNDAVAEFEILENKGREIFGVDVAKACHHGSQHIIDSFIRSVNSIATVISSGDKETHSHPRPDALGAYGKMGRSKRPLIFSTELARSTNEFTPQLKNYLALRGITLQIEAETDKKKKAALEASLENKRDRNVAVYGMITLRATEDRVIIAQKLEEARSASQKWDIYELHFDAETERFVYDGH